MIQNTRSRSSIPSECILHPFGYIHYIIIHNLSATSSSIIIIEPPFFLWAVPFSAPILRSGIKIINAWLFIQNRNDESTTRPSCTPKLADFKTPLYLARVWIKIGELGKQRNGRCFVREFLQQNALFHYYIFSEAFRKWNK